MVRISKNPLRKEFKKKVHSRFIKTVVNLHTDKKGEDFLEDLLSSYEIEMLAKRFAALHMLAQNLSAYRVHKLLHMSYVTTKRLKNELRNGKHQHIVSAVKKKSDRDRFWAEMEVFVRLGMPEMGKGRWKWLDDMK